MRRLIFFKTFILLLSGENKISFLHWHAAVLSLFWSKFWFFDFDFLTQVKPIWMAVYQTENTR